METWVIAVADYSTGFGVYLVHDACVVLTSVMGAACMGCAWYIIHKVPFL